MNRRPDQNRHRGFSILELLLMVIIVAFVLMWSVPHFIDINSDARTSTCRNNIHLLNTMWEEKNRANGTHGTIHALLDDTGIFPDGSPACPQGTAYVDHDGDQRVDAHSH